MAVVVKTRIKMRTDRRALCETLKCYKERCYQTGSESAITDPSKQTALPYSKQSTFKILKEVNSTRSF
jgi:hypothetical protein